MAHFDPKQLIKMLINSNPRIQNNPMAQTMIEVIQSGNNVQGEQIAENLCKTYGVTREQATQQAENWLYGMMRR